MSSLAGIIEQNEIFELSNQSINFEMSEQSCNLLQENNKLGPDQIDFESDYFINTKQLYKIWFNKDPDIFLSESNKNRLIDLRKDNSKAQISLLYSAERLSSNANAKMQDFLSVHCIKAVDLDQVYKEIKNDPKVKPTELKILSLAKEELDNFAKGNFGGNPAAASDLLRVSKTMIEKLGIYSDFDVHLKFDNFPLFLKIETSIVMPSNNNDFLAFSCGKDCKSINLEAEKELIKIQEKIIVNYDSYANGTPKDFGYKSESNSVTEARAFVKNIDAYNLFKSCYSLGYSGVFQFNKEAAAKNINSLDILSKEEITELFFEVSTPHSIAYYLEVLKDYQPANYISYKFIIEEISKSPQAYGIKSESLINKLVNKEDNLIRLINQEIYSVTPEEVDCYEFISLPNEHKKDNLLDDDIKKKYHELFINVILENRKFSLYKNAVTTLSGPNVLHEVFGSSDLRYKYSPDANHIEEELARNGVNQDASWYLNKL